MLGLVQVQEEYVTKNERCGWNYSSLSDKESAQPHNVIDNSIVSVGWW